MLKFCKMLKYLIYYILAIIGCVEAFATEPPAKSTIHGVVTDQEGNALPYVTIFVEGTTKGTTTDSEGRYTLHVGSVKQRVTARMLGYTDVVKEVDANNSATVDFTLTESSTEIDAVVVEASGVSTLRRSAFNAVAVDMQPMKNTLNVKFLTVVKFRLSVVRNNVKRLPSGVRRLFYRHPQRKVGL